jgi:hypothetical protein
VAGLNELRERLRAELAAADAARAEELSLSAELRAARLAGSGEVAALEADLAAAAERRESAERLAAATHAELASLAELAADPVAALGGEHPIALLPVRIETRFTGSPGAHELLVRVYPDELHVDDHEPGLTDYEVDAARAYWERVWRAGTGDVEAERAAFAALADRVGTSRASWVARATEPDPSGRPAAATPDGVPLASPPVLKPAPRVPEEFSRPAHATVLPDRWAVLGYRGGAEVARAFGSLVPDRLQVGPSPDLRLPDSPEGEAPPVEDGLRWLVDFAAAESVGMGIRVPLADERGFDRLVVLGVRVSLDPGASADRLEVLLGSHRYTRGLGYLRRGTPTNNTDAARAGATAVPAAGELFDLERSPPGGPNGNAERTARALGAEPGALERLLHARDADDLDARRMHVALWPATAGYVLETLMAPGIGDRDVAVVREQFVTHVRGGGPLPSLRVGRQPYGLLPVTSLARWRAGPGDDDRHATIVRLLRNLAHEWLARARTDVPHVGRPGGDPDQELLTILGREALSRRYRVRPVRGMRLAHASAPLSGRPLDPAGQPLADAVLELLDARDVDMRLRRMEFDPRAARIRRPLVHHGALSETEPVPPPEGQPSNYLRWLADRRERTGGFPGPDANALLFALLQHSLTLADADAGVRFEDRVSVVARKAELEPELVDGQDAAPTTPTLPAFLARPVSEVSGGAVASRQPVGEFLAGATRAQVAALGLPHVLDAFDRASAARTAVRELASRPSAVLDRVARELLDVCSFRLDAWITSYASRRLDQLRAQTPAGVHLGGYAWVENLRPKPAQAPVAGLPPGETGPLVADPTNAGFVHAPSLGHATAAAILRGAHLGDAPAGENGGPSTIDLSSDRVRRAMWIVDGVRQGQPVGALLGYRIERGLHDRSRPGLELDRFIRPLRALAPLVAARREDVPETVEAVEGVAATNVVDGLALLRMWQADPSVVDGALAGSTPPERAAVTAELTALADAVDAVSDLLLAESVLQLANGSPSRAAASIDALGSGTAPIPELEVAATPRHGRAHTYRVLTMLPAGTDPAPGWEAGAGRPRRVAEPRLDRLAGTLLGPARNVRAAAGLVGPDGSAVDVREFELDRLGLCPLDLVYDGEGAAGASAVEALVADRFVAEAGVVPDGTRVELLHPGDPDWPGDAWPPTALALNDAIAIAAALRDVIGGSRPASATDLVGPAATAPPGSDEDELAARAEAAAEEFGRAAGELADALAGAAAAPDDRAVARVRTALAALGGFGTPGAPAAARRTTGPGVNDPEGEGRALLADAAAVAEATAARAARLAAAGTAAERLSALFGERFVVAPVFAAAAPGELEAALDAGSRAPFLDGDPAAPLAWLQRSGRVREGTGRLSRLLLCANGDARLSVAQLPLADRWVALPFDGEAPAAATSLVLHSTEPLEPGGELAGLVVDEWSEVVPERSVTTGIAFHFDEPGSRAPHAVLLAVHPEPGRSWSLDALAAVLGECADLAAIRMVGPREVPWLGRFVPALYFAENTRNDTVQLDFRPLVTEADG